jgi:hypothetical protein
VTLEVCPLLDVRVGDLPRCQRRSRARLLAGRRSVALAPPTTAAVSASRLSGAVSDSPPQSLRAGRRRVAGLAAAVVPRLVAAPPTWAARRCATSPPHAWLADPGSEVGYSEQPSEHGLV